MFDHVIVPAQPEFYLVTSSKHPSGRIGLREEPIVAWRITGGQTAEPVVLSGRLPARYGVRFPDGRVMVKTRIIWSTEEEPETASILAALASTKSETV